MNCASSWSFTRVILKCAVSKTLKFQKSAPMGPRWGKTIRYSELLSETLTFLTDIRVTYLFPLPYYNKQLHISSHYYNQHGNKYGKYQLKTVGKISALPIVTENVPIGMT